MSQYRSSYIYMIEKKKSDKNGIIHEVVVII